MAFQFCTNDFYLYAETELADPGQTQVTSEPESEPSDSTGEAAEETPPSDIGTPEPSAPVEEQPAAPVEEQPAPPVEEQPEVASTLKVEFVDVSNASVKETVEQALTSKYVKDTINLDEIGIDINVEGYTLTEVKDKNDNTQAYTTETKDFVLTGNVTELQFVYTQNVQTDQPEDSQEPSTPQGGQEDQNSEEDQEDTDDEDSDSQTNEGENESADSSKDDELAYPEQILSATASDGAIITIIASEGTLPEGVSVEATLVDNNSIQSSVKEAIEAEGKILLNYKAYDITIYNKEGQVVQPKKNLSVSITNSGVAGQKEVFHLSDDATNIEKVSGVSAGYTQTFTTDHFSIYVVAGGEQPSEGNMMTVTINFVYESGVIAANPYVLNVEEQNGKYTVSYEIQEKEGYTPTVSEDSGFTITDGVLEGTFDTNDSRSVDITYVANAAQYTVEHLFQNLDEEYVENETLRQTLSGKVGDLTEAAEIPTEGFTAIDIEQEQIEETGTVVQIKYERNTYTLTYLTLGGSYVPSVPAKYEQQISLPSGENAPTRKGYTFVGWYTDEACEQPASDPYKMGSEDTKLYAKWDGAIVDYSIVYLTENANDDNYSYAGTVKSSAKAGTEVTADASTKKPVGFDTTHFTFEESSSAVVNADGSTVITVKYSRNEYTITFAGTSGYLCGKEEHTHSHWCHIFGCDKKEHEHDSSCGYRDHDLTITAKYQADISELWNKAVGKGTPYEGRSWYWDGNKATGFQSTMPGEKKTISMSNNYGDRRRELIYYVEDPNGTINYEGKTFREYTTVVLRIDGSFIPTYNEEFFVIDGYDRYASTIDKWSDGNPGQGDADWDENGGGKFYYTRSEYELQLINGERSQKYNVPYTADLHEYLDGTPEYNPLGDGTFEGWYLDPEFQESYEYNGDYKMPKGLVLYAKWNPVKYTVKFVDSDDTSIEYDTQTVESKGLVDVVIPEKSGYVFKGWYTENDTEFDYATQITGDLTLYAKWEANQFTTYTVKYVTPDGEVVASETKGSGKVGSVVQAKAKKAEEDFEGYTVDAASKTIELQPDSSLNVITFIYTKAEELKYTVEYVDEMGSDLFTEAEEKTSTANYIKVTIGKESLDEIYSMGYRPKQNFKWVSLTTGKNIVTFECTKATYSIKYELNGGNLETSNPETYTPADLEGNPIILNNPTKTGYKFTGWEFTSENGKVVTGDHDPLRVTIESGSYGDLEFTAKFEREARQLKVNYIMDDEEHTVLKDPYTEPTTYDASYNLSEQILPSIEKGDNKYVLDSMSGSAVSGTVKENVEITLVYSLDEDEDGTPDKYEATVTYNVVNGTFEGTDNKTTVTQEYELATQNGDGTWTATPKKLENIPTPTPNTGYHTEGEWDTKPTVETEVVDGAEYTYTYEAEARTITVNYIDDNDPANVLKQAETVYTEYDAIYDVTTKKLTAIDVEDKHYVLDRIDGSLTGTVKDNVTVNLVYSLDEDEDGTPDKYEATVTYNVVNGTFEGTDNKTTVTQEYELATQNGDGTWTATPKKLENIPTPTPNTGYHTEGEWDTKPTVETEVVDGAEYTYTYARDFRTITVTPYEGEYDGQEHNVTVNGTIKGDKVEYSLDGGQTYELGIAFGVADVTLKNDGVYNVTVRVTNGGVSHEYESTIKITPRPITITTGSATKTYDGTPLTNSEIEITKGSLVNKSDLEYRTNGTITNAGTAENSIVTIGTIEMQTNYDITVEEGTLTVTPRPITLTSGSASKNYDGTALTNSEVTITSGSLVNASDVTYAAVGSITNVGSSLNRISVSYASEQMARNYVVTLVEGTLTVNTAPTTPPTTPTTPPTTPGTPGTTTDDGATTDEPEVEEVEDEETPLSDGDVEDIEDNATPKGNNGIWALINLIAAIVTVILGLILLLSKRHRNDEEEDEEERQARIERGEEKEQEQKRGWICKVLGVIVAIVSVVFFILTEDMSLPMALTDKWTIWMIVIAIVELVLVLVGRHWKDVDDEDQEQQA